MVICRMCRQEGVIIADQKVIVCPLCLGEKMLSQDRIREARKQGLRIYTNNNPITNRIKASLHPGNSGPKQGGVGLRVTKLSQKTLKERAQLNEEQMDMLDNIAAGSAPRNALAIIHAMKLKMEYAYEKPIQKTETIQSFASLVAEAGEPEVKESIEETIAKEEPQ